MSVVSLDRYRSTDAAAHYESRQSDASAFAEALADNELRQRAAFMCALGGQRVDLRDVRGFGGSIRITTQPFVQALAACLDHESVMEVLIDLLQHEGGERMAKLRVALADAFVKETAEAITEVEQGLV